MDAQEKLRNLIGQTEWLVRELKKAGKSVHFIWDADHVLIDGMSHEVFEALGRDLARYREYELRQFLHLPGDGPWTDFARQKGRLHDSQHVVSARSSYGVIRIMFFCLDRGIDMTDAYFVGTQSKRTSYDLILSRLKPDPDMHVFCVDDTDRHVDDFEAASIAAGMEARCVGIRSPRLIPWSRENLLAHAEAVLSGPAVPYRANGALILPAPLQRLLTMFHRERAAAVRSIGDGHRET